MSKERLDEIMESAICLVSMISKFQASLEGNGSADEEEEEEEYDTSARSVLSVAFPTTVPDPVPVSVTDSRGKGTKKPKRGSNKPGADESSSDQEEPETRSRIVIAPTTRRPGGASDSASVASVASVTSRSGAPPATPKARSRVSASYEHHDTLDPEEALDWTDAASRSSRIRRGNHHHPH